MSLESHSVGSNLKAGFINILSSNGDVKLTNVSINADKVNISAVEGLVRLMLGTNSYFSSKQSSGANLFLAKPKHEAKSGQNL